MTMQGGSVGYAGGPDRDRLNRTRDDEADDNASPEQLRPPEGDHGHHRSEHEAHAHLLARTHPTSRNRTARIIRSCCVIAVSEPLTIIISTRRGSRTDPLAGDPWTDVVLGDKEMHWNPADP